MSSLLDGEAWPQNLDAVVAAPKHHSVLFENEAVRILDTRIAAGERTPIHTHRWPAALYIQSWSPFVRRDGDGAVTLDSRTVPTLTIPPQALWTPALQPHSLENVGTTDLHVISVELKLSSTSSSPFTEPNKALQPTPTAVTPSADARVAPASGLADL